MKRIIRSFLILSILLVGMMLPAFVVQAENQSSVIASGQCGKNVYWKLDASGTMTISGNGDMWGFTDGEIYDCESPWAEYRENIVRAIFEEGVTLVGVNAFRNCTNLEYVSFGDTITCIEKYAFMGCEKLENFVFPTNLRSIWQQAFDGCKSLTTVNIPNQVTYLDAQIFANCTSLKSAYIGGDENIGMYVFANCMFRYCDSLEEIRVSEDNIALKAVEGVLYSKDGETLVQYPCGKKDVKYIIPEGTTSIFAFAIEGADYLEEILIPNTVVEMNTFIFTDCAKLQYIELPSSLQKVGDGIGVGCPSLEYILNKSSIEVPLGNGGDLVWVDEKGRVITTIKPGGTGYVKVTVETPAITVSGDKIIIKTVTENASIHYTIDGSTPTTKNGTIVNDSSVMIDTFSGHVKAIAVKRGYTSDMAKLALFRPDKMRNVSFSVKGVFGGRNVTFNSDLKGAKIYYSSTTSTLTTSDKCVNVGETVLFEDFYGTIYARTYKDGVWGNVCRLILKIPVVKTPTISIDSNGYATIRTATPNSFLYYTTDGSTPSMTNGKKVSSPYVRVYVGKGKKVKAIAVRSCFTHSDVAVSN